MVLRRNSEPGRQAVLWLATAFVVLIGAAGCTFIILAAVENPSTPLLIMGSFFVGLILLLVSLSASRDARAGRSWMDLWMAMRGKSDPKTVLRIGRKKASSNVEFGNNAPPTLDSVRNAAAQNVTWVPHGPPPDRKQRPR